MNDVKQFQVFILFSENFCSILIDDFKHFFFAGLVAVMTFFFLISDKGYLEGLKKVTVKFSWETTFLKLVTAMTFFILWIQFQ